LSVQRRKSARTTKPGFWIWGVAGILFIGLAIGYRHVYWPNRNVTETENQAMKDQLDEIRKWLWEHPPNGTNRNERRERMQIIQHASNQVSTSIYLKYCRSWTSSPTLADALEQEYPALSYLRAATQHAIQDIRNTQVQQGVAIWYFYNMGYVFKTPESCFGIDLHFRDAEVLAHDLDFLLITHGHRDHYTAPLLDAMLAAEKPVITRWYAGSRIVKQPEEFRFGKVRVKVDIGDHHRHLPLLSWDNMLMFQIDCGASAKNVTIYHSGDGNRFSKMRPDKPVDIFIVHAQLPMDVGDAIRYIKPTVTLVSHVLELSHSAHWPLPLRWSFDFAFNHIQEFNESEAIILTWGERWLFSGINNEKN
jgi:hypothetical protein